MKPSASVTAYIQAFPPDTQIILKKIRTVIAEIAPEAEEGIFYGLPGYKFDKKPLVYFGAWKHHIGFYATPSGNEAFKKELSKYKPAKGSVKFPLGQPIPYGLIIKIIKYRVKEVSIK